MDENRFRTSSVDPEAVDPRIIASVEGIVRDSRRWVFVFGISLCVPIIALFLTIWMALRLIHWYYVNGKYDKVLQQIEKTDSILVLDFRRAKSVFWFASFFWPIVAVLIAILIGLAYLFGGFERG